MSINQKWLSCPSQINTKLRCKCYNFDGILDCLPAGWTHCMSLMALTMSNHLTFKSQLRAHSLMGESQGKAFGKKWSVPRLGHARVQTDLGFAALPWVRENPSGSYQESFTTTSTTTATNIYWAFTSPHHLQAGCHSTLTLIWVSTVVPILQTSKPRLKE